MATPPVTVDDLRSFLNLDVNDTTEDDELTAMLSAATEAVEARVGPMVSRSITDVVYGRNGLVTLRAPVISVESMSWQGSAFDLTLLDVDLKSGVVSNPYGYSLGCWWWSSPGAAGIPFAVTYTAGRVPVPDSLKQATMIVAEQLWKTQRGPAPGQYGGSTEQVYTGFLIPARAEALMAPYERLAFA